MKTPSITQYDMLEARQALDKVVLKGQMLLADYTKADENRSKLIANNDELEGPNANIFTAVWVIVALLGIILYQVNVDAGLISEQLLGNATATLTEYPWYIYLLVVAICLMGFFSAEGVSRNRYLNDRFGKRTIHKSWLTALAGVIIYIVIHAYLGIYMLVVGGGGSEWSAVLPCFVAFVDLFLGLMFGSVVVLTLRLTWLNVQIKRLSGKLFKTAQQVNEARGHFREVVRMYYEANPTENPISVELDESMLAATEFLKQLRACLGLPGTDINDDNKSVGMTPALSQGKESAN